MSQLPPALLAALAAPMTHVVLARYESGKLYRFESRSLGSAENHAITWRRKIGRELICTWTGDMVRVVAVEVITLAEERERLAAANVESN